MIKFLIYSIFIFFTILFSLKATEYGVMVNYTPSYNSGYLTKQEIIEVQKQFGVTIEINNNIVSYQYFNLNGFNVNGLMFGFNFLNKTFDSSCSIIDRFTCYGAVGLYNTSFAPKLYIDTNYPEILLGVTVSKNIGILGLSYSYFSGFRMGLGFNY